MYRHGCSGVPLFFRGHALGTGDNLFRFSVFVQRLDKLACQTLGLYSPNVPLPLYYFSQAMARQFSTISYSFMLKENRIRLKKGQFALGDARLMLLSTKMEQVQLIILVWT